MPVNIHGQYIDYNSWSHAPTNWIQMMGFPPFTGGPLLPVAIPMVYNSPGHYSASLAEQNGMPIQPPPAQPPQQPPESTTIAQTITVGATLHNWWQGLAGTVATLPISAQDIINSHGNNMTLGSPLRKKTLSTETNKFYNIPLYSLFRSRYKTKEEGEVGLEIECEGMNLFDSPISYWTCHPDGSLRTYKDHPPIEYVLRKPLSRPDTVKALDYLTKKLKQAGSFIHNSHRTSVHVHVNCQDLTLKQIVQYWCLYTVFEEILVEFSGPDRPGNLFCLSSKQAEYQVKMLESALLTENFQEIFSDNLRYTSCNTASLGKFGSLEFRSLRGTVDQGLIQTWIDLLLILKDKALKFQSPKAIVEKFQSLNPEKFLEYIFGDQKDILAMFKSHGDRHKLLWDGLRLMRDVAMAIEWEDKKDEVKKKTLRKKVPKI